METSFDKASENASEDALVDDEDSFFIAADYHHRLQLPTACTLLGNPRQRVRTCLNRSLWRI
jgi:hypothetical protein